MQLNIFLTGVGVVGMLAGVFGVVLFPLGILLRCISGRRPADPPKNSERSMVFVPCGAGSGVGAPGGGSFHSSKKLRWIDPGDPAFSREPVQEKKEYIKGIPFMAGGKKYISFNQLCCEAPDGTTKDIYGRRTVCFRERFPCFDSYDYLYENRYYRWAFLCCDGKLTRIYFRDEGDKIYVTEDVSELENSFWESFRKLGLAVDPPEIG